MIPERTGVTVDSTVQGEDVKMSIDQSALAHIMNVLTDLYADPELAVLREYSTNAWDSHIEAGQTRPIEVTTPTDLRPMLVIRDYGVGLDAEDIRAVYSQYGKSTKRETNDAVGMLGLGCKSALAFVDQFTLAGIKDGQRIVVSIARDETGAGTMTVLESGETDEPDGVEVCIPASQHTDLETKAYDFFSYWQPGAVLLNGAEPSQVAGYAVGEYIVADRVDNAWNARGRHDHRPLTVVMGNVSYPPPDGYSHPAVDSLPRNKRIVVTVPIGAVNFTPSREELQDSDRTRKALDLALEGFTREVEIAVAEAVTGAPSRPAAAKALIEARAAFGKANVPELEWEGEEIPTVLSAEDLAPIEDGKGGTKAPSLWAAKVVSGYRGGESHRYPAGQISLDDAGTCPWVLSYSNTKWTASQRRKLNRYLEHHELHAEPNRATVFITDAAAVPRPEWIDGAVVAVDWQTVREWKDPVKTTEGGVGGETYAGTYPAYYQGWRQNGKYPAEELAKLPQRKLFYVEGEKWSEQSRSVARILGEGAVVVSLVPSRAAKFKRLFPDVRDGLPIARKAIEGKMRQLSDLERAALSAENYIYGSGNRVLCQLDPDALDDPKLARAARILRIIDAGELRARTEDWFPLVDRPEPEETDAPNFHEALQPYVLLDSISVYDVHSNLEHVVFYVNAVYAANSEEDN